MNAAIELSSARPFTLIMVTVAEASAAICGEVHLLSNPQRVVYSSDTTFTGDRRHSVRDA